jgi:antitoxin (DNA-binding transcriptional repressor) of toxin-antitoxin stability system
MKRCLLFFHDTFSRMNSISVADLGNRFADVSAAIRHGEKLLVRMRGVPFATLASLGNSSKAKMEWPDRSVWRARIFPESATKDSAVLDYDRGET